MVEGMGLVGWAIAVLGARVWVVGVGEEMEGIMGVVKEGQEVMGKGRLVAWALQMVVLPPLAVVRATHMLARPEPGVVTPWPGE